MHYHLIPVGTCSTAIDVDVDKDTGKIISVKYTDGCDGNLKAVAALAKGMTARELISRVDGIKCGYKDTSCSDQLAKLLRAAMERDGIL